MLLFEAVKSANKIRQFAEMGVSPEKFAHVKGGCTEYFGAFLLDVFRDAGLPADLGAIGDGQMSAYRGLSANHAIVADPG